MNEAFVVRAQEPEEAMFTTDAALNAADLFPEIATACENQCVHCNVNSAKLGRTRS